MNLKNWLKTMKNESVKISDVIQIFENSETDEILSALFTLHDIEDIENYVNSQKQGMIEAIESVIENIDYMVDAKTEKPIDINIFCSKYLGVEMRVKTFLVHLKSGRFSTGQLLSFFDRVVVSPQFIQLEITV